MNKNNIVERLERLENIMEEHEQDGVLDDMSEVYHGIQNIKREIEESDKNE